MTTITINNPKNFSSETLVQLLQKLELEVVAIEEYKAETIPEEHLESIEKGIDDLHFGRITLAKKVHEEARRLCTK